MQFNNLSQQGGFPESGMSGMQKAMERMKELQAQKEREEQNKKMQEQRNNYDQGRNNGYYNHNGNGRFRDHNDYNGPSDRHPQMRNNGPRNNGSHNGRNDQAYNMPRNDRYVNYDNRSNINHNNAPRFAKQQKAGRPRQEYEHVRQHPQHPQQYYSDDYDGYNGYQDMNMNGCMCENCGPRESCGPCNADCGSCGPCEPCRPCEPCNVDCGPCEPCQPCNADCGPCRPCGSRNNPNYYQPKKSNYNYNSNRYGRPQQLNNRQSYGSGDYRKNRMSNYPRNNGAIGVRNTYGQ